MNRIKINHSPGMFMVPDSFVDNYIKDTNPSFIKLYIYILRHSNDFHLLTIEKISEDTGLLQSDVLSGLNYLEKCGALSYVKSDSVDFINVSGTQKVSACKLAPADVVIPVESADTEIKATGKAAEKKYPKNSVASSYKSAEVLENVATDKKLKHLFSLIQQMLNKNLTTNDYKIIYSFIDYLKLPERVILTLFEYCISIGKTSMRYIETVAYAWADKGITNIADAEKYINETNEKQSVLKKYKRKFKLVGRDFSDAEAGYVLDWIYNLKASEELIMQAYEKTILNTGKINFSYMNAIIRDETNTEATQTHTQPSNVKKSNFRNYPTSYEISDDEKKMIEKIMAEFNGEDTSNADNE